MKEDFVIALSDLRPGSVSRSWHVGREFFEEFENEQVRSADLEVTAEMRKNPSAVLIDMSLEGTVTVPCDRCLEDVAIPIHAEALLKVRPGSDADEEDGREMLPTDGVEFDLAQVVYDYACLSLPLQCRHPEGECNPAAERYLNGPEKSDSAAGTSPFAALKDFLND